MSRPLVLAGLTIYAEHGVLNNFQVEIANGCIQTLRSSSTHQNVMEFPASYSLLPGFIDLHVHGANGKDVMDASQNALATISHALAAEGVTGFLATTMTASKTDIEAALLAAHQFRDEKISGARLLGVHLEGPFLAPEKVGAQNAKHLLPLDQQLIQTWQALANNVIKIVTLAPELLGSEKFIRHLVDNQIVASIGHTNATYAESMAAINAGCTHVTHLFNAMRGMHQREPGTVGAALLSNKVSSELIVDGVHVHPALVQLTLKLKGVDKMVLVTDAMRAKCLGEGSYDLGGQTVTVKQNVARLADGTLAGSTLTMVDALKNMLDYTDCKLIDVVKMTAENPAKILGIFSETGSIAVGKKADLVVLDENFNVVMTIVAGQIVFQQQEVVA